MNSITQFKVAMTIWTLAKVAFVTFWATLNPFYVIPAYFLVEIATSMIIGPEIKKIRVPKIREDKPESINEVPTLEKVPSPTLPENIVAPIEKTSVENAPLQDTSNRKRISQKKTATPKKSSSKKPYKPRAPKTN